MRKDMPVGADAGFTKVPIRKHVSITLPRKQMIAAPSGASSKRSIGAQIVTMIHVDEEPAIPIKQLGNGPQCALPVFRSNVAEYIPQAGDDAESLAYCRWKAFRADWPDLDSRRFIRWL